MGPAWAGQLGQQQFQQCKQRAIAYIHGFAPHIAMALTGKQFMRLYLLLLPAG